MNQLFVIIVPIGREHININFRLENFIYEAVLLRDSPAPLSTAVTLQRFQDGLCLFEGDASVR